MQKQWIVIVAFVAFVMLLGGASGIEAGTCRGGRKKCPPPPPPPTTGVTVYVPAGGDLQGALYSAIGGDIIELQAGAVYPPVVVPVHSGTGVVTVRTRGTLPARRVGPADAPLFATIASTDGSTPVLTAARSAAYWTFDGVQFTSAGGWNMIVLGDGSETQMSELPHHFTFDRIRCFVGDVVRMTRCFAANTNDFTLTRSDVRNIKQDGFDAQAVAVWQPAQRQTYRDNYLEASGENFLAGGAIPGIKSGNPSDVLFEDNTLRKPLSWFGSTWTVKNLFELKAGVRFTVRNNLLDGNWPMAQVGYSVLFTPRGGDGSCTWCAVTDILFENNTLINAASGINILGHDDCDGACADVWPSPTVVAARITIRNNLLLLDTDRFGGDGDCYQLLMGPDSITIDRNTCLTTGRWQRSTLTVDYLAAPVTNFIYTNNISRFGTYGIMGGGDAPGTSTITNYFPGSVWANNVLAAGDPYWVPYFAGFWLPSELELEAGFVSYGGGNYNVTATAPWTGAGATR